MYRMDVYSYAPALFIPILLEKKTLFLTHFCTNYCILDGDCPTTSVRIYIASNKYFQLSEKNL